MPRLTVPPNVIRTSGNDVVKGEEVTAAPPEVPAVGIDVANGGIIDTLTGKDLITGSGDGSVVGVGIRSIGGNIRGGLGDDTIQGRGNGTASVGNIEGGGIGINTFGSISGGSGDDLIKGIGTDSTGSNSSGITIGKITGDLNLTGSISGGNGNDTIEGRGSGYRFVTGIDNRGSLDGNDGNDIIRGVGTSNGNVVGSQGYGIVNVADPTAEINGGNGDDIIEGTGTARIGTGIENQFGSISGGRGDDLIKGTGFGFEHIGAGYGIFLRDNSTIKGDEGKDSILGYGTTVGILGSGDTSVIDGGKGDDYFQARCVDLEGNPISNQGGAISDVTLLGGRGDDIFDVGYGNATINGNEGMDTLILLGSSDNYHIQNNDGDLAITRDGYTLNALSIELTLFV